MTASSGCVVDGDVHVLTSASISLSVFAFCPSTGVYDERVQVLRSSRLHQAAYFREFYVILNVCVTAICLVESVVLMTLTVFFHADLNPI